jgi:tetratricopeptide (TPR) repeat protein
MKLRIHVVFLVTVVVCVLTVVAPGSAALDPAPSQEPSAAPAPGRTPGTPARSDTISLEERADIMMARKSYGDAADLYYRALKESKFANAVMWNKLGIAYQQQTNYNASRKAYNQAIHRRSGFSEAWNNLGTTYFMQNKFRKSVKYYLRALKLNPNSAPFHLNLGTSYYHMKEYKQAVDEYRTALTIDPNVLAERSKLGTVVQARGADVEYYFYLAKVFASLGRAEDAVRYLRRAFEDGFKDQKRIDEDPDFLKISKHPAYVELMKNRPVPIKE